MLQSLHCIRFGELLMDENQKLLLLCLNCHTDYTTLSGFHEHLRHCNGVEALTTRNAAIKYSDLYESKLGKHQNGHMKQFLIHNINDVLVGNASDVPDNTMCPFDLDAELMDPRWYTDMDISESGERSTGHTTNNPSRNSKQMQFKENVKTSEIRSSKARRNLNIHTDDITELKETMAKVPTKDNARNLYTRQNVQKKQNRMETKSSKPVLLNKLINRQSCNVSTKAKVVKNVLNGLTGIKTVQTSSETLVAAQSKRNALNTACVVPNSTKHVAPIASKAPILKPVLQASTLSDKIKPMRTITGPCQNIIPNTSDPFNNTNQPKNIKQTEQILNKLQNLGLQIKRTSGAKSSSELATVKDSKTMELMKKLEKKGIKCSVVNTKGAGAAKNPNL